MCISCQKKKIKNKKNTHTHRGKGMESDWGIRVTYPRDGVGESSESETVIGIDGEFGVDEENDGLLDGVQAGEGSSVGTSGTFHLHQGLGIDVHAQEYVFVVNSRRLQTVPAASLTPPAPIPFIHHPLSFLSFSFTPVSSLLSSN